MPTLFTRHRYELPLMGVLAAIAVVELLVVHFLLFLWSPVAAWTMTAVTLLFLLQLALLVQGMKNSPIVVDESGVTVTYGRRGKILVPISHIASVEDVALQAEERGDHVFRASILAHPNVALRLKEPVSHKRRPIRTITMRLDEPAKFQSDVRSRITVSGDRAPWK